MKMEQTFPPVYAQPAARTALSTNRVLRDTYLLLSATLFFSAVVTAASVALKLPHPGIVVTLIGFFGLLYVTTKLRNSAWGLAAVFGLTGFMGYTLGPIVSHYLSMPNGHQVVMMAMGAGRRFWWGLWPIAETLQPILDRLGSGGACVGQGVFADNRPPNFREAQEAYVVRLRT